MRVFRGPKSKSFFDDSHERVAIVNSDKLAKGIKDKAIIQFNISKDGKQREAVCTVQFEETDFIPMAQALLSRLEMDRKTLTEVKKIAHCQNLSDTEKVASIQKVTRKIR